MDPQKPLTAPGPGLLTESDNSLPLIYWSGNLFAGASVDPEGQEGLTRLLGRLMRRTAAGMNAEQIDERIDTIGAALGASAGITSLGLAGSVISRSLSDFTELVRDVITRPSLDEAELGRLVRETLAEIVELRDSDQALGRHWFRRKMFANHAYGRSVIGTETSLNRITRRDALDLYTRLFNRENFILSFAGDITHDRAQTTAARMLEGLPSGEAWRDTVPEPAPIRGRRLVFVDKPERTQTQILIGGLGTHPADEDHDALAVANTVFGGTFTARLTQEVRSKRGWSYGAYSNLPYDRHRQAFSMWTFPKAEDAASCIELELDLLNAWCETGITEEELDWVKRYLVRSHAFAIDTAAKRLSLKLEVQLYGLAPGYHTDYLKRVQAVTLAEANAAIRRRISTTDLLVVVVGTASTIYDRIQKSIPNLAEAEVVAFDSG